MRKSKLLAGVYNVYTVFDKVSKHYTKLYFANTDEEMIRLHLPEVIADNFLRDVVIFKIGIFNDVTGEIKQTVKKRVQTDCYLFPHSKLSPNGENLKLEDMEKVIHETKNEILANLGNSEEDNNSDNKED